MHYRTSLSLIFLTFILLCSTHSMAEVFKTVDSHGKVVYSSRPDQNANSKSLDLPKNSTTQATNAPSDKPKVTLFATRWCGYCRKERTFLREHSIEFNEIDTETPQGARKFKAIGGIAVPVTFIDEQRIDGYDEETLGQLLKIHK